MARSAQHSFIQLALDREWLTPEQATELGAAVVAMEQHGLDGNVAMLAVKKKYLTKKQAGQLSADGLKSGQRFIGDYRLLSKLGQGSYGSVFRARRKNALMDVALKVLNKRAATEDMIKRFQREAQAILDIDHPHIVKGHEFGEADGYHFIVMDLVEAPSVAVEFEKEGIFPEARALRLGIQMASALVAIHEREIVHRDIKPANILIDKSGSAQLVDLGLAKPNQQDDKALTKEGAFVGTPYYISPEQARGGRDVDIRSDIYSLGATLYHLVTGHPPFEGGNSVIVIAQHLSGALVDPRVHRPKLSAGFASVMLKMLAREPDDRYDSPAELLKDVSLVKKGQKPKAPDPLLLAKQKNMMRIGVAAVALVVVVGTSLFLFNGGKNHSGASSRGVVERGGKHKPGGEDGDKGKKTPLTGRAAPGRSDGKAPSTLTHSNGPSGTDKPEPALTVKMSGAQPVVQKVKPQLQRPKDPLGNDVVKIAPDTLVATKLLKLREHIFELCKKGALTDALLAVERAGADGLNKTAPEALNRLREEIRRKAYQALLRLLKSAKTHAKAGEEVLAKGALRNARRYAIRPAWEAQRREVERSLFGEAAKALRERVDRAVLESKIEKENQLFKAFESAVTEAKLESNKKALAVGKTWASRISDQYTESYLRKLKELEQGMTNDQWQAFWPSFFKAMQERSFKAAEEKIVALKGTATEEMSVRLETVRNDIERIQGYPESLQARLKKLVGRPIKVGEISGRLKSFKEGRLDIDAGEVQLQFDLKRMTLNQRLELGGLGAARTRHNINRRISRILLLFYGGRETQARDEFKSIKKETERTFYLKDSKK